MMGNRILKESICTSEDLDKLSPMAEILFYRLIVKADDYGAYHGNPAIIKSTCFPLKSDDINCEQVKSWLSELEKAGLIQIYRGEDRRQYLQFRKWAQHQQIRAKKRRFPEPDIICEQMLSSDIICVSKPNQTNPESNPIQLRQQDEESNIVPHPDNKPLFLVWTKERGISDDFASHFYERNTANGWRDANGEPIRNWQNYLLEAWRKNKESQPAPQPDTMTAIRERRQREAQASHTPDDVVEWPKGTGQYRLRAEVEAAADG